MFMAGIIYRRGSNKWTEPTMVGYELEEDLVRIITEFPELLPGVSADSYVCQEFETPSGPIDVLIINANDGSITIVEAKLARNAEIRRKIIGQIIDYAASLRTLNFDEFNRRWQDRKGPNLENIMVGDVPLSLAVSENLQASRFTLLLAVDEINEPLKQMVVYVNEKTDSTTRVALIELARHVEKEGDHDEIEFVISQTFGYEANKPDLEVYGSRKPWGKEDFASWLLKNEPESLANFEELMTALAKQNCEWGGTKAASPSGVVQFRVENKWRYPFSFHSYDIATIQVAFADLRRFNFMNDWIQLFDGIEEINQNLIQSKDFAAYPKIALSRLSDPLVMKAIINACTMAQERAK